MDDLKELSKKASQCVKCGSCMTNCPVYTETLSEVTTPRGKMSLIESLASGEIQLTRRFQDILFNCLVCDTCGESCPNNVKVGESCYITAQVGISGSVKIGNHVTIFGQVGIADHISIADETVILGQSGIHNDIKRADILFGTPARGIKEHHRIQASLKYLPELLKRVKKIERRIEEINGNSQDCNNRR